MRQYITVLPALILSLGIAVMAHASDPPGLPGELIRAAVTTGGMERTYLAYVPSARAPSPALVIVLHGSLGTGERMRDLCAGMFDRLAEQERCIVVYPDGFKKHWNDCRTVPGDDAHAMNIDDVAFMGSLIDACRERWGVDPSRVYAAGLSNGGHLCFRLAVEMPERIAGIAVIGASMPLEGLSKCPAPGPGMPVMIVSGTDDPVNPFAGGMVKIAWLFRKGAVRSTLETARLWIGDDLQGTEPLRTEMEDRDPHDGTRIERLTWPGGRVALYVVHGGGHTVPGGRQYLPGLIVGRTSRDMDTAREMWAFFQAHAR